MSCANWNGSYGLAGGHAYTILDAMKVNDKNGREWKLVKVRNPWASEGYNGPWSRHDHARWTDDLRQKLGETKKNDGVFFMPSNLYRKIFGLYWVTKYQDWHMSQFIPADDHNGVKAKMTHDYKRSFTSPVDQDFVFTLRWHSGRKFPRTGCTD